MKPILFLRHEPPGRPELAARALEDEGFDVMIFDAWEHAPRWPRAEDAVGIVVFGGTMNVDDTDHNPFLLRERELILEALEEGVPFLGICLGAQLLARSLHSPVVPATVREVGFTPVFPTGDGHDDPLVSLYRPGDLVFHWHEDMLELPAGAELLATGNDVRTQAYRVGDLAWGVQFHPEIDRREAERWIDDAGASMAADWGKPPSALRAELDQHLQAHEDRGRELFGRFAGIARARG